MSKSRKPLGIKNYGSIPHLSGSRMGPADHHCHEGHERIATVQKRDKNDEVFVLEKLDGSNVGVGRIGDEIYAIGRSGYLAATSPYKQHVYFANWVTENEQRFLDVLEDGQRLVGEWLALAHGTIYTLHHEPFVAFDIMTKRERMPYDAFIDQLQGKFVVPHLLSRGDALSIESAMALIGAFGFHGAQEQPEGAMWRVERDKPTGVKGQKVRNVDFLVKYVRSDKVDGKYLSNISGNPEIWLWQPEETKK